MKSMSVEDAARYLATSGKTADTVTVQADIDVATDAWVRARLGHEACECEHARRLDMAYATLRDAGGGRLPL